jgi:hypothetical protein
MKVAACLFSYNRPRYLQQVLASLEGQVGATCPDWFFYQDGPLGPEDGPAVQECVKMLTDSALGGNMFVRDANVGIARQKLMAHSLFSAYDLVYFFADDMIVSPFYMKLLGELHRGFPEALVYAPDRARAEGERDLRAVSDVWTHFWGYAMGSALGHAVTPFLREYVDFLGDTPYRQRPSDAIRARWPVTATSHDAILDYALRELRSRKMTLNVPRARYIGEHGLHATPEHFQRNGFSTKRQFVFPEDAELTWEGMHVV